MKKMRPTPAASYPGVAALVKANLSDWYLLLALFLSCFFIAGCDTTEEQGELENNLTSKACSVTATAVSFNCAYGAFNNEYLQLPDGTYLQPWVNATGIKQLEPGRKYLIGFVEMEPDGRYNDIVTCKTYVPYGKPVKITCLQPTAEGSSN